MKKVGFDSTKYVNEQSKYIMSRLVDDGKLYIECGGKLLFDLHAARVLPGFEPSIKMQVFQSLKEKIDLIICIFAGDIERRKMRSDFGISYDTDVLKMIDDFAKHGIVCKNVVITRYENQPSATMFKNKLEKMGINVYTHSATPGYPTDVDLVVSKDGYGKNPYIETEKPIVLVTAPGPGSGKLATCLSQMYHDAQNGVQSFYSKFETFPVWNLDLHHPVNIAYEAATIDLADVNLIDPFHLNAYKEVTVNYNRDIEAFPLLTRIIEKISHKTSPFKSPTDMGVNRIGFGIVDDEACRKAANEEIIRRFFRTQSDYAQGIASKEDVERCQSVMDKAKLKVEDRTVVVSSREALNLYINQNKEGNGGSLCSAALELSDGQIVTAHNSLLLHAGSAVILNALKEMCNIDKEVDLISPEIIESITLLKRDVLSGRGVSLNIDEILICLAMSATTNEITKKAVEALPALRDCEVHFSHIPSSGDLIGMRKLGLNVTSEPVFPTKNLYNPT